MITKELVKSLEQFIENYYEKVTLVNATQIVNEFDESWKEVADYTGDLTKEHQSKYGLALVIYSVACYDDKTIEESNLNKLSSLITEYDTNDNVKYQFGIKQSLYFNLGSCWHQLGVLYDSKAVEAFKKYVFYLITTSSHTRYQPEAYGFRKCSTHLYQSLINEELNISSPTTFNDPFDCPIRSLLE